MDNIVIKSGIQNGATFREIGSVTVNILDAINDGGYPESSLSQTIDGRSSHFRTGEPIIH